MSKQQSVMKQWTPLEWTANCCQQCKQSLPISGQCLCPLCIVVSARFSRRPRLWPSIVDVPEQFPAPSRHELGAASTRHSQCIPFPNPIRVHSFRISRFINLPLSLSLSTGAGLFVVLFWFVFQIWSFKFWILCQDDQRMRIKVQ